LRGERGMENDERKYQTNRGTDGKINAKSKWVRERGMEFEIMRGRGCIDLKNMYRWEYRPKNWYTCIHTYVCVYDCISIHIYIHINESSLISIFV
jgi:hypothetical protein